MEVTCTGSNEGDGKVEKERFSDSIGSDWWHVGTSEVAGLSTCKGRRVKAGDEVIFTFPFKSKASSSPSPSPGKGFGRGRQAAVACSEIVRFSTKDGGEVCMLTQCIFLNDSVGLVCAFRMLINWCCLEEMFF